MIPYDQALAWGSAICFYAFLFGYMAAELNPKRIIPLPPKASD